MELTPIKAYVADYIDDFHQQFDGVLKSKSEWLTEAVQHLATATGKQVRPLLTSLIGKLFVEDLPQKTIDAAVLLELIHTATLIHDDVIDEANTRRGVSTLNAIYDNRIAVLMGDFILSSALLKAISLQDLRVMNIISSLGRDLTEGEIKQYETADKVLLSEETYFEVIHQKTAILFMACAEIGAMSVDVSQDDIDRVRLFGEKLGYAFQIRDDIFDYYKSNDVGKPTGNDIREGKITLPLLYALQNTVSMEQEACMAILKQKHFSQEDVARLISFAVDNDGIEYATKRMQGFVDEAKALLEVYPRNEAHKYLDTLADFIVERKR